MAETQIPDDMSMVDWVAEAIYDARPQWGDLWSKTEKIQEEYRVMARAAIDATLSYGFSFRRSGAPK